MAIARFALGHFAPADQLCDGVRSRYPALFERVTSFLEAGGQDYDDDSWSKDVRYALGLSVPAGALSIDLRYYIGPKLVARNLGSRSGLAGAAAYLRSGPFQRWYNDHLDLRDMSEFNPAGWTSAFKVFAEMLKLNPSVRGIAGVSWFYDPAVTEVSPRMAYVRRTQVDNGAFLVKIGPGDVHTANATATSPTRKMLFEAGKYVPTSYLIAWPRAPLLRWAEKLDRHPELAFA